MRIIRSSNRLGTIIACLVLSLALSGCADNQPSKSRLPWSFEVKSYTTTDRVAVEWGNDKHASPGYEWLILDIAVGNRTSQTEYLNSIIYEFHVVVGPKAYQNQLRWDYPIGGLDWDYVQPGQVKQGAIYHEVPIGTSLVGAKLRLTDTFRGISDWIDLTNVPRR